MEQVSTEKVRCAYCNVERPIIEMKRGKIIFISSRRVCETTNWYCADKPCHIYDQMSHEG